MADDQVNAKAARAMELETVRLRQEIARLKAELQKTQLIADKYSNAFYGNRTSLGITRLRDSAFIDVNDTCLEVLGYQRAEMIGRSPLELNIWSDLTERETIMNHFSKTGYVSNFECKLRTKGGRIIVALVNTSIIEVNGDKCMLTAGTDITERKKAEEALKMANEVLQQEKDNLSDCI